MRTALLASAAVVGLLFAVPAWAEHDHNGGGGGNHSGGGGGSHGAPAAVPGGGAGGGHNAGGGQGSWNRGGNGGASPFAGGTNRHIRTRTPSTAPGGRTFTPGNHHNFTPGSGGYVHNRHGGNVPHGNNTHAVNGHGNYARFNRNWTATQRFHFGQYQRPPGWYYRRWSYGDFLPSLFFAQSYWINDYNGFDLDEPPPGAVWVRYGSDALLIDEDSGQVIQVAYGIFY